MNFYKLVVGNWIYRLSTIYSDLWNSSQSNYYIEMFVISTSNDSSILQIKCINIEVKAESFC